VLRGRSVATGEAGGAGLRAAPAAFEHGNRFSKVGGQANRVRVPEKPGSVAVASADCMRSTDEMRFCPPPIGLTYLERTRLLLHPSMWEFTGSALPSRVSSGRPSRSPAKSSLAVSAAAACQGWRRSTGFRRPKMRRYRRRRAMTEQGKVASRGGYRTGFASPRPAKCDLLGKC